MMLFERELETIEDRELQYGIVEVISAHEEVLGWCPTSASGRFHLNEPLLKQHLRRTFRIAHTLAEHEHLGAPNFDITIAAALIHDIGKCKAISLDEPENPYNYKHYQDKFWVYIPDWINHPITGALEVMKFRDLPYREIIANIIYRHHHYWPPAVCPATAIEERIVSMADYIVSRPYIKFTKGWNTYDRRG
jgi:hypothetical protein